MKTHRAFRPKRPQFIEIELKIPYELKLPVSPMLNLIPRQPGPALVKHDYRPLTEYFAK